MNAFHFNTKKNRPVHDRDSIGCAQPPLSPKCLPLSYFRYLYRFMSMLCKNQHKHAFSFCQVQLFRKSFILFFIHYILMGKFPHLHQGIHNPSRYPCTCGYVDF